MSELRDLRSEIEDIIHEETQYMKHYIGRIVDVFDVLKKGRVKVTIEELGFLTPDTGIWCNPRQGNSLSVPKIGQYAEVYFINGDRSRPVYLYPVAEIVDNTPTKYDGNPLNHIIFEDPNNPVSNIKLQNAQLILFDGTESYVLGDSFLNWLTNYINNIFNLHAHTGVSTGGGTSGPPTLTGTPPSNILSLLIKGK